MPSKKEEFLTYEKTNRCYSIKGNFEAYLTDIEGGTVNFTLNFAGSISTDEDDYSTLEFAKEQFTNQMEYAKSIIEALDWVKETFPKATTSSAIYTSDEDYLLYLIIPIESFKTYCLKNNIPIEF